MKSPRRAPQIIEIRGENQERFLFFLKFRCPLASPESLVGGDAENAAISRAILSGEEQGAKRMPSWSIAPLPLHSAKQRVQLKGWNWPPRRLIPEPLWINSRSWPLFRSPRLAHTFSPFSESILGTMCPAV